MTLGDDARQPGRRSRWILGLILLVVMGIAGAVTSLRIGKGGPRPDPMRLGLLHAAWSEFQTKRYDRATAILDRRAKEVAPTALDWMLRARIAESQDQPAAALEHLSHIPDSDAIAAQARLKAGQLELGRHRARAAEAAYRHALELDPELIQPRRELAYLYAAQRRKAECDAQFRALARRMPLDYLLAFAWCQNACDLWDVPGARKVLIPFVTADPDDRPSRLALATSYILTTELDQAEAVLGPLPDSDPDARALRARLCLDRGDLEAAETLLRSGPAQHLQLNLLRGRLALQTNNPRRAVAEFRAAFGQDPQDRNAIHGLGVALRSLGDPTYEKFLEIAGRHDQLKRVIKESVTTIETDSRLFFKLGEICEALDRRREARVWYQLAIGRDPLDRQAHQALARLDPAHSEVDPASGTRPGRTN